MKKQKLTDRQKQAYDEMVKLGEVSIHPESKRFNVYLSLVGKGYAERFGRIGNRFRPKIEN